ncbi:putative subtilase family serine protease,secreted [Nostocoides japonicum T1-X7]|uniref:Putative subtilase family serine protease,secreted n=1 Tax=Nostocoides japonicum T1-X7 TaxID=1194083 RepID=A0A077LTD5_9MICO|nr:S53 family peptidase [Tetrasphaera japonica]CCH76713.1 putative subtilase family serine protease,secreted [Tetrasphaera japonica T1-X7]
MRALTKSQAGLAVSGCVALTLAAPGLAEASNGPGRHVVQATPAWTATAHHVGAVSSGTAQHLSVVLALRDAAGAEALADAVSTPGNAQYGRYLTPAQWRARFAPTDAQVKTVRDWLTSNGFHVVETPANHRYIEVTAPASVTEKALATRLGVFTKGGRTVQAPETSVSVPDSVSSLVAGVTGLDTSAMATPLRSVPETTKQLAAAARPSSSTALPPPDPVFRNAGPCSAYYGQKKAPVPQILKDPLTYAPCGYRPGQIRGAYGLDASQSQGVDGRGVTVAIVDAYASKWIYSDAATYAKRNDPSHPLRSYQFSQNLPASYSHVDECGASGWYGEETLDVEAVHATAPGAHILYVGGESCYDTDLDQAVNTVVDNGLAQVVTNSYGETEAEGAGSYAFTHQTALQAAAQGISLLFSSGDDGDEIAASGKRQVDAPANDAKVTAVGGTSLAVTKSDGYGFEQGWGTGKSTLVNGAWSPAAPAYLYGGGGGTSRVIPQPAYQKGVVPNGIATRFGAPKRAVPDVAMLGDPSTGLLVGQSQTFPNGTIKYSEYRIGGTSLSSPLFAGVVAVADQVNGGSLGFLNPTLYKLAGTSAFRDVNHGRKVTDGVVRVDYVNGFDGSDGTVASLRTFNQTGTIWTRKGYDDVTGVGSPNGVSFLTAMARGH